MTYLILKEGFTQNQNLSSKPWDWKFPEVTLSGLAVMEFTFSYHIYIYIVIRRVS